MPGYLEDLEKCANTLLKREFEKHFFSRNISCCKFPEWKATDNAFSTLATCVNSPSDGIESLTKYDGGFSSRYLGIMEDLSGIVCYSFLILKKGEISVRESKRIDIKYFVLANIYLNTYVALNYLLCSKIRADHPGYEINEDLRKLAGDFSIFQKLEEANAKELKDYANRPTPQAKAGTSWVDSVNAAADCLLYPLLAILVVLMGLLVMNNICSRR